jgi:hypothetical protein
MSKTRRTERRHFDTLPLFNGNAIIILKKEIGKAEIRGEKPAGGIRKTDSMKNSFPDSRQKTRLQQA